MVTCTSLESKLLSNWHNDATNHVIVTSIEEIRTNCLHNCKLQLAILSKASFDTGLSKMSDVCLDGLVLVENKEQLIPGKAIHSSEGGISFQSSGRFLSLH